jgi:hypothetical protein
MQLNIIVVIDRFEDKYAVLETQEKTPIIFNLPHHLLPPDAKEVSVLTFNIDIDKKETTKKKKQDYRETK